MDDFGTLLMTMFLAKAWPQGDEGSVELIGWSDVSTIMFDVSKMAKDAVDTYGVVWRDGDDEELDRWLMEMSETGQFDGVASIPENVACELHRRAAFSVAAAMLEENAGEPLNLPLPAKAPDGLKGWALVLYILGGAGREYPEQFAF